MAEGPIDGSEPCARKDLEPAKDTMTPSPLDVFVKDWQECIRELEQFERRATDAAIQVYNLGPVVKSQRSSMERLVRKQANETVSEGLTPAQCQEAEAARVSNLDTTTWRTTWPLIKKYGGLLHINKRYLRGPRHPVEAPLDWQSLVKQRPREEPVVFDAIVENGATWVKVIHGGHVGLLKQIARAQWEMGDFGSESGEDEDDEEAVLKSTDFFHSALRYVQAARWNHCRCLHFLLVNILEGEAREVDALLQMIRALGDDHLVVEVRGGNHSFIQGPAPPLDVAIDNLLKRTWETTMEEEYRLITPGVANLDPSVLFALVSDLLHGPVPQQPEGQRFIIAKAREMQQDGIERKGRLWEETLQSALYPALLGRKLVCTRAAAAYFWNVIDAIATESEETRGALILPRDGQPQILNDELRSELQKWSNIPVFPGVQLPVQIVDDIGLPEVKQLVADKQLPSMALQVARDISPLNRSIYLYGWAHRITTISSHRGIPRQIELSISRHWKPDDAYGPDIWTKNLQGYLVHREKPTEWREMLPGREVPHEIRRWANDWDTWGRGISSYGIPDSKTWEGVGHPEIQRFGRGEKRKDPEGVEKPPKQHETVVLPWDEGQS